MGYVFRVDDAERYNKWFQSEPGLSASDIEKELMLRLWAPSSPQRVLEVGCGTGIFLEWFAQLGHQVTGIDPSAPMLDIARRRLPRRVVLDRGYAEHLPYEDNAFDTVSLITTLEFVDDPVQALSEAVRVARSHVLLGVLNKYSYFVFRSAVRKMWKRSVFSNARLYSVPRLLHMSREVFSGQVPVHWGTCLTFPLKMLPWLNYLERSQVLQHHPFGQFIAMKIDVAYTLRTVQHPLFSDVPSGLGHSPARTSCWLVSNDDGTGISGTFTKVPPTRTATKHTTGIPLQGTH